MARGHRSLRAREAGALPLLPLSLAAAGCAGDSAAPAGSRAGAGGAGTAETAAVLPAADRKPAPDTAGKALDGSEPALRAATAPHGVRMPGVNVRDCRTRPARQFERAYELLHYPSIHDPDGALLTAYPPTLLNPRAIPSTLAIDRQGRIAMAISGPVTRLQALPWNEASTGRRALLMVCHCAGLGAPFMVAALAFRRAPGAFRLAKNHHRTVMRAGGAMLVLVGLLLATGIWTDMVHTLQLRLAGTSAAR
ncbi:cytochrome c biogenesis protein CcdA [Streptomyces sp. NPDC006487]|uniref:cytochrome c biogenesis protein CcdA n=1 Tax=Streptomyces sp. NPDC006487 TaxID=3364748 RepID=UPI0036C0B690